MSLRVELTYLRCSRRTLLRRSSAFDSQGRTRQLSAVATILEPYYMQNTLEMRWRAMFRHRRSIAKATAGGDDTSTGSGLNGASSYI